MSSSANYVTRDLQRCGSSDSAISKYYGKKLALYFLALAICLFVFHSHSAEKDFNGPRILYIDVASGPISGGEDDLGTYISIFGKNFGTVGTLGTKTKVYLGDSEVAAYKHFGTARGRSDIKQITVQPGRLAGVAGRALKVTVVVGGERSNDDKEFLPNPGKIYFVDNVSGDDETAETGNVTRPFRFVQTPKLKSGLWGKVQAGDTIVLRGRGRDWNDVGFDNYFLRIQDKSGSIATGSVGSGPITILGYPGEDVYIRTPISGRMAQGGISAADTARILRGNGHWVTISNLRIESGGNDGPINTQAGGSNWRVVNNELSAADAIENANAKAGGIAGNGKNQAFIGNRIHSIYCGRPGSGPLHNHGIYVDGNGSYEIAFNHIEDIPGGNGFQAFNNGTNGSSTITDNISFHHNYVRNVGKHGLNLADGTGAGVVIFNNIVIDTALAGLRLNTRHLTGARIYNNTFAETNLAGSGIHGAISNDWQLPTQAIDIRNNIFVPSKGTKYIGGSAKFSEKVANMSNNLWFGGRDGMPSLDKRGVSKDPAFNKPDGAHAVRQNSAAIDAGTPAVNVVVNDDFTGVIQRPQGRGVDIGAFEFVRAAK